MKLLTGLAGVIASLVIYININKCYIIESGFFAGRMVCKLFQVTIIPGTTVVL